MNPAQAKHYVELLTNRAAAHPDRVALHFLADGNSSGEVLSYADLDRRARSMAAALQDLATPGERAIIVLPSGLDYVVAFFGCLYAGVIAVPAFPPESARPQHQSRLLSIISDAAPRLVLTARDLAGQIVTMLGGLSADARPSILAVSEVGLSREGDWRMPDLKTDQLAFLQYTSGSTAAPKGVMVGHDNLMANERAIQRGFTIGEMDTFVSWLPLYHDMGLVGGLLQPLYSGICVALMSPRHFLERPVRWLEAVSRFRGTVSGGPDFAFRLCVERVNESMLEGVDLSSWRLAFCGAEPIRPDTLARFAEKFATAGLNPKAPYPCYGLAEATLLVTGGTPGQGVHLGAFGAQALVANRAVHDAQGVTLVGCGESQLEHDIVIADVNDGRPLSPAQIGEIRLAGPSVTHGYWRNEEASAETFVRENGRTWLRTGDLGFLQDGELFVTGRIKDLILVRGQNLYPQDIEQTVEEQVELIRKGRVAAFAVDIGGREGIGIAAEVSRNTQKRFSADTLCNAIREAVAEAYQEPASLILLLNPGALPKTTSGKLQRAACRKGWQQGTLDCYAAFEAGSIAKRHGEDAGAAAEPWEENIAAVWREVLGIPVIDRDLSFFAQGGDSIAVMRMLSRLGEQMGLRLEPRLLFEASSLRRFAAAVHELRPGEADAPQAIPRHPSEDRFPLSPGQQALWFLAQLAPDSTAYHIAGGLELIGNLDLATVKRCFEVLAIRHTMLRATFHSEDGQAFQRGRPSIPLPLTLLEGMRDEEARAWVEEETRRPFDLEQVPLWRINLVQLAPTRHELHLTLHHLIADGWSLNRLLDEFAELYRATSDGRKADLPPLTVRYGDYAAWHRSRLDAGEAARQLAYWTERLGEDQPILELPVDHPRPTQPSHRGGVLHFRLDDGLSAQLQALALHEGATVFMVLLAVFKTLLHRYSGQSSLRVGVPMANRPRGETENLVGYFVNTLVLRTELEGRLNFGELIARVRETVLGAQAHPDLPFEQLVEALHPQRSLNRNPLFQVMVNHQRRDFRPLEQLTGLGLRRIERDTGGSQFDLSLETEEDGDGHIAGVFTYALDLFEAATIDRLRSHFEGLLRQVVGEPGRRLGDLALLTAEERAALAAWNRWERTWPEAVPVHALIARQARARPEAPALVCGTARLSFAALDASANRLARRLLALGGAAEAVVGVVLPRSLDSGVALLGVLKAGCAFLPLDPALPPLRLQQLLDAAGARRVVTHAALRDRLGARECLCLDGVDLSAESDSDPDVPVHPGQLAYLIHTSGSTGTPKAVAVSHAALVRHVQAAGALYGFAGDDLALHFAAFSFDAAVEQWAAPLCHGAGIVLGDPQWTGEDTAAALEREGVTVVYPPTPHLLHLAEALEARGRAVALRVCTVGGEAVPRDALARLQRVLRPALLINGYGPTETVVTPLAWVATPDCPSPYAPIGRPLGERTAWVLDAGLNPLPVGVAGELYIGGPCLARGYAGRPGLTAERFLPDPFGPPGGRLYRTGDRVRRWPDGTVEYLGRLDQQIKLRGYRIEPGEIEAALLALDGVAEACVLLREDGGRKVLAAYVSGANLPLTAETLRAELAERLPDYLVPAHLQVLARLPRTAHGKVDRAALPAPERRPVAPAAPRDATEQTLLALWQALLGRRDIGIHDNFFELGGDSILSLQVVSRARQAGLTLTPQDLFQHQSVARLAHVAKPVQATAEGAGPVAGAVPLLPIQAEFFARPIPRRAHWNQALLLQPRVPLDPAALQAALAQLMRHHDAFRLRFRQDADGTWTQAYAEAETAVPADLWRREAEDAPGVEAIAQEVQRSLNLETGPLLRAAHIRLTEGGERLLLAIHHLAVDGVSWRLLLEDLQTAYARARKNHSPQLPAPTAPFQAWARRLEAHAQSETLAQELAYWESQLQGVDPALPCDRPDGPASARHRASCALQLDADSTRRLLQEAGSAYRTRLPELLLAALARVLTRWSGQAEVLVELEGHGREPLFEGLDLSRSVGWFTCVYPVRLSPKDTLADTVKTVKEQLRRVPNHGLGYGMLKHLAPQPLRRRIAALPSPKVTFNYLGQFDASFEADALYRLAPEGSGDERDPDAPLSNELEINGQIHDGRLSLDFGYSQARYREETLQALVDAYRDELLALIAHCTSGVRALTPADFPLARLTQEQLDALHLDPHTAEDLYPLSPMQQGLLFHALREPEAGLYITQLSADIQGLDVERFIAAWRDVVRRHAILRTGFLWQGGLPAPLQAVFRDAEPEFLTLDWRGRGNVEEDLDRLCDGERDRPFDLARPPLLRLLLVRLAEDRHRFVWTSHHLLMDGWSQSLLLGDVLRGYEGGENSRQASGEFRDYIAYLQARETAASEAFWRERLQTLEEPTLLAQALSGPAAGTGHGLLRSRLSLEATEALRAFSQAQRITLNTLVQGAWVLLLQRYCGRRAVAFGATVAGRPADLPGVEAMLGLFINTLPVIQAPGPSEPIGVWLRALQAENLALREHEHLPLYEIQRWLAPQQGAERDLFDTLLVFENYPVDEALKAPGLRFGAVQQRDVTSYALTVDVDVADAMEFGFDYARDRFHERDIRRLSLQLEHLLLAMAQDAARPVGSLSLSVSPGEAGTAPLPCQPVESVHAQIARRSRERPKARAVVCEDRIVAYGELETRASRLAHRLLRREVRTGDVVGLYLKRSPDFIVAALATLKAGAAFLPLDPAYPAERLGYMLRDSGAVLLVADGEAPFAGDVPLLRLDREDHCETPVEGPAAPVHPQQPAYVIYTSGSTGKPKGVVVAHDALAMHCRAMAECYGMTEEDRTLHFASFSFDASVEQWAVPLIRGACVVLSGEVLWSGERTAREIQAHGITRIDLPPEYLAELAGTGRTFASLRTVTSGGEALRRRTLQRIREGLRPLRLINAYGPTEAVITPLLWVSDGGAVCDTANAPIGAPVGERSAYVLDVSLDPLPPGVAGELFVGGTGLALGYLGQAGLTAERFLPDPRTGGRMYRTGDRARRLEDGTIEYLGRTDEQVKIRGFRIEPGEIEALLRSHPGVDEAAAVVRGEGADARLTAYAAGKDLEPVSLREWLKPLLPAFMLPARIAILDKLPRLPGGKLDRRSLPEPEMPSRSVAPPRNETEGRLLAIWREILETEEIGVTDDFFELGGHSLLALRLVSAVNQRLGWNLSLAGMLQSPTIEGLARKGAPGSPLIRLNRCDNGLAPLFCAHPAGGTVFGYRPLAQALAGRRPVHGLLCRAFLQPGWNADSLEEMALDYADLAMAAQPEGPLHLLGWSLGGAVAMAMAHHMERCGREVAFLGLVDPYVPGFDDEETEQSPLEDGDADWSALHDTDLATGLNVMRRLSALAKRYRIEPLRVAPHCWWSDEAGAEASTIRDSLEKGLQRRAVSHVWLRVSHTEIIRAPAFLNAITGMLGGGE